MNKTSVFYTENFDSYDVKIFTESMEEIGLSVIHIDNGETYEFVISHKPLSDDELCDFMRSYYEDEDMSNDSILEMVVKDEK